MKTRIFSLILLLGALFTSCDSWEPNTGSGKGTGQLLLSDINVLNGENVISRADGDYANFIVTVLDAEGAVKGQWTYGEMPEVVELPVANDYTVNVKSHNQADEAWDLPYYEGSSDKFNIENNKVTRIGTITCKFANIAVTIRYAEAMKALMGADCKVTVVANQKGHLEFAANETRTGYFKAVKESPTLVATFEGTVNGSPVTFMKNYDNVVAGNHYYINFSVKVPDPEQPTEYGDVYVDTENGIVISMTVDEVNVSGNVDVNDNVMGDSDRPGKEDPKDPEPGTDPNPGTDPEPGVTYFTFTCPSINFDAVNDIVEGESYCVEITSVNPIEDLTVIIDSPALGKSELEEVGLSDRFNVAKPGSFAGPLTALSISNGDAVYGKTSATFDITTLVPLIPAISEPGQIHKFNLIITDNEGNTDTRVLTFKS